MKSSENELNKKMAAGFYRNIELSQPEMQTSSLDSKIDQLEGIKKYIFRLHLHCFRNACRVKSR
jgi:hypothetical protein